MTLPLRESLCDEGAPEPCPAVFNMAGHVLQAAGRTPDKVALEVISDKHLAESWTFAELDAAIRGTAAALHAMGLGPGERVALRMANTSAFPILFFGVIAAGGIAVPTSSQLTDGEFLRLVADMEPRFVALADRLALDLPAGVTAIPEDAWEAMRGTPPCPVAATRAEDPAFIIYTSGTSGRPRGVLHAQRSAWARRMMWRGWYGLGPEDRLMHAGAFNWTYTLGTGLTDPWAAGATTLVRIGPPAPELWPELIAAHGATIFAAVPGVYRQMLRSMGGRPVELGALRHGLTAGERMPEALSDTWRRVTGRPVYEALGMSEVSTYLSASPDVAPKPGTCGRPQRGRRIAILPEDRDAGDVPAVAPIGTPGHLAVSRRDPGLMLGYWRDREATAAAFRGEWFLTGDRAAMDAEGYVTYHGRADEVMTALGYRVAPQEVEEALLTHSAIAEIAVAELPVRTDLSLIAAFVVLAEGCDWPGDDALAEHAASVLAPYKCPRVWKAVSTLPRSANGKLMRRVLVETHRSDQR